MSMNGNSYSSLRRPLELLLGTGIPLLGFFCFARSGESLWALSLFIPAMWCAGWHILKVNDLFFERDSFLGKDLLKWQNFIPVFICPLIAETLLFRQVGTSMVLLLIMINWDIYSLWGKRHWLSGLLHNFIGGGLHLILGAAAAGQCDLYIFMPLSLFFAFTMAGAAFHHDALHEPEDRERGFKTGAVRFGRNLWWRLGIIPIFVAQFFLLAAKRDFFWPFATAFVIYLVLYLYFSHQGNPSKKPFFRIVCRLAYATAGLAYLAIRIINVVW